jgi:hypothetical protein
MAREMEMRDKSKAIVVDKLLLGTRSPFSRRVQNYRLLEKFKVAQILSYIGIGDPIEHLENFQAHLDLHGTPDDVVCQAFPLTLSTSSIPTYFLFFIYVFTNYVTVFQ